MIHLSYCLPQEQNQDDSSRSILCGVGTGIMFGLVNNNCACTVYTPGTPNPYFLSLYPIYKNYYGDYKNIIIGDSTMTFSTLLPGYLEHSVSYAVYGNTLCDMAIQLPVIHTTFNSVIISSAGGDDMLHHASAYAIIRNGSLLINQIRLEYPGTRIVVIGVHETDHPGANELREKTNKFFREYLALIGNSCYLDPDPLFGTNYRQYLMDGTHYNPVMSEIIRQALKIQCSIDL